MNLERIFKNIYRRYQFLKILVNFNDFVSFLKKIKKKKEFELLCEFPDFGRLDL